MNYERKAPASLQGFMAWLRAADTEVKRDMEISRDEVRVMTVHGAKGLEASVVFMVDTTSSPSDSQRLQLIQVPRGNGGEVVVWAGRKADDPKPVAEARNAMLEDTEDEYRRLLYVAITRAADRLIVGGCLPGNRKAVRKLSWYDLIDTGLTGSGLDKQTIETPLGKVTRFARPEDVAAQGTPAASVDRRVALPDWLRTPGPRESLEDDAVRPSGQSAEEGRAVRAANQSSRARWRCNAARWCTGCCNPCPTSPASAGARPRSASWRATPPTGPRLTAPRSPTRCSR